MKKWNKDNHGKALDRYPSMSPKEKRAFESYALKHPELRERLALMKDLGFTLKHRKDVVKVAGWKSAISGIHVEPDARALRQLERQAFFSPKVKWFIGGLSVIAITTAVFFLLPRPEVVAPQDDFTEKQIFAQHHMNHFPAPFNLPNDASDDFRKGKDAYEVQDYSLAHDYLDDYLRLQPNDKNAALLDGISLAKMGQYENAIILFKSIIFDEEEPLAIPARKYLGLCYFAIGDPAALEQLKQLKNDPRFGKEARGIIKDIEREFGLPN